MGTGRDSSGLYKNSQEGVLLGQAGKPNQSDKLNGNSQNVSWKPRANKKKITVQQ